MPGEVLLLLTAVVVGLAAGGGAVVFRWLIALVSRLSFQWLPAVTSGWGSAYVVLAPVGGGLLVGLLVCYFAPEARGHGVPEVMEAVALKNGRIRPVVALIKSLASSICIGSGGSVGREGPIVQIGSALGSSVGQALKLSGERVRNLVACGAAGGIAATFNAPIAGALFALEVILGDFSVPAFGTVVVASVTASVVGRAALGDVPAFRIPTYAIHSLWEFGAYLALGVLAAAVATVYTRSIYAVEDLFDRWTQVPIWSKPAFGGLLLGLMALTYARIPGLGYGTVPQVYGVGYDSIESALRADNILLVMVALMVLKILATSLTLGSGGSGGVFAPGLFIGAMLGASVGLMANALFPEITGPTGAYALVGMGAVFGASTQASMTAVIIMFEMTGDYKIILPLMFTVVIASWLTRYLLRHQTIYTMKLVRRGVRLEHGRDVDVLRHVRVSEAMTREITSVRPTTTLEELTELFLRTNRHAFPVLDDQELLCGIVSLSDLRGASPESREGMHVGDIMTSSVITAYPDETLDVVLARMGPTDLSRLPVVSRENPRRVLAVVRRNDIVRAYNLSVARQVGAT